MRKSVEYATLEVCETRGELINEIGELWETLDQVHFTCAQGVTKYEVPYQLLHEVTVGTGDNLRTVKVPVNSEYAPNLLTAILGVMNGLSNIGWKVVFVDIKKKAITTAWKFAPGTSDSGTIAQGVSILLERRVMDEA